MGAQNMTEPTLTYVPPAQSLTEYVSFFYDMLTYTDFFDDVDRADYPQFRFILQGDKGRFQFIDGHTQKMPKSYILGPTTGNTRVYGEGNIHMFGACLLPAGWAAIMPMDASTAVNRAFDAVDLFGPRIDQIYRDLQNTNSLEERLKIGNTLLEGLIGHVHHAALDFTRLVDDWLSQAISPDVDELVQQSGVSRRQVERNCNRYYGAPPKMLARKFRALRAAIQLAKGETGPSDLIENGFYDQSHFIREIKHFTGMTPTMIQENLPVLTQLTLRRNYMTGAPALVTTT